MQGHDRFGNRWQQNGSQSMQLAFTGNNPANPQNNNRMDSYSYDSAGNLMNDGVHNYFYDAENRVVQVDGSAGYCNTQVGSAATACYFYDAFGRRVFRTNFTLDGTGAAKEKQIPHTAKMRRVRNDNERLVTYVRAGRYEIESQIVYHDREEDSGLQKNRLLRG